MVYYRIHLILQGGGCGEELAKWVKYGQPEKDMYGFDIRYCYKLVLNHSILPPPSDETFFIMKKYINFIILTKLAIRIVIIDLNLYHVICLINYRRFYQPMTSNQKWLKERSHESYAKNYALVFLHDQPLASRKMRLDPLYEVYIYIYIISGVILCVFMWT